MQEPGHLDPDDAHAALRLVADAADAPGGIVGRKQHLLAGLATLVAADVWVWALQHFQPEALEVGYYTLIDGGWESENQRLAWIEGSFSPEIQTLLEPMAAHLGKHATFTRRELLPDEAWYESPLYRKYREPVGLDDLLISLRPVDSEVQSAVRLHRAVGRPPFGARERALVHAVTGGVEWLHRVEAANADLPSLAGLSRRERQVLTLLLAGHGRKQIAAHLGLSEHTVGDYTKEIHRHFEVHSRGELLARFLRLGGERSPDE